MFTPFRLARRAVQEAILESLGVHIANSRATVEELQDSAAEARLAPLCRESISLVKTGDGAVLFVHWRYPESLEGYVSGVGSGLMHAQISELKLNNILMTKMKYSISVLGTRSTTKSRTSA